MKYTVKYKHYVEITYDALVEADSPEEAEEKLKEDFDFISEEEVGWQGISVEVLDVEEAEEE
ncbi:hypothetical protein HWC53_gp116 [Bacillus phage vB_BmeM-Goe8]|uniref:Uncharacterized protein n=1 Tax=Bacillus phage vB_BmeM-Goe8 TaxID=2593638 RepID=A0A516KN10_9CAUD|nr:hypothetical protein HWC53_gp116 [Bacillus phage vB_BmeM-Goe8]QDP42973.1 hypothetical protein Goe8_c02000 [Bacillus phage vB_BmeM-Goe8]